MSAAVDQLFSYLRAHEAKYRSSVSLIPSENVLSPLARLAFLSDAYSRYFFDEYDVFGKWSFEGGSIAGQIQREILIPLLRDLGGAEFVDVRAVSGLTAMTTALAAFSGGPGTAVMSVPVSNGGHPDTAYVASKLGLRVLELPFADWRTLDLKALSEAIDRERPALIYIDHSTCLFPLDIGEVIATVRAASSSSAPVHVHVDTSHVNGLVWGGSLPNPLRCGADSYGGSTHKTFPGPHKAVLLTNSEAVSERLTMTAVNMISHHHLSDVIALAIAVVEFAECDGAGYARAVLANARSIAQSLSDGGLDVQGYGGEFTRSHQAWIDTRRFSDAHAAGSLLYQAGVIVNPHSPLPSIGTAGLRLGVNEASRLGISPDAISLLAGVIADVVTRRATPEQARLQVRDIRASMRPSFCFDAETLSDQFARLMQVSRADGTAAEKALAEFLFS